MLSNVSAGDRVGDKRCVSTLGFLATRARDEHERLRLLKAVTDSVTLLGVSWPAESRVGDGP